MLSLDSFELRFGWQDIESAIRMSPVLGAFFAIFAAVFFVRSPAITFMVAVVHFAIAEAFMIVAKGGPDYILVGLWVLLSTFWAMLALSKRRMKKILMDAETILRKAVDDYNRVTDLLKEKYEPYQQKEKSGDNS